MLSSTAMRESILRSWESSALLMCTPAAVVTLIMVKWLLVGEAFVIGVTRLVNPEVAQGIHLYKPPIWDRLSLEYGRAN